MIIEPSNTSDNNLIMYTELLNRVFGENSFSIKYIDWLYKQNPAGEVIGFDAYDDGHLIAHYATIPVIYENNNRITKGLLSLNTATHPNYQGKGLFIKLAKATIEIAKANDFHFIIGVSNKNSTYGFVNKLGFRLIAPLEAYIYAFDNPINTSRNNIVFKAKLSSDFIMWRLSNPKNKYFNYNNRAYSQTNIKTISALLSKEFLTNTSQINKPLLKLIIGLNNRPNTMVKIKIPEWLKPSPLNLILLSLNHELPYFNESEILFEAINFDAY